MITTAYADGEVGFLLNRFKPPPITVPRRYFGCGFPMVFALVSISVLNIVFASYMPK